MSAIWIVVLAVGGTWRWRARCNPIDVLALDTATLLRRMLARAKTDLFIARCLYAGVPLGALVGAIAVRTIPGSAPLAASAPHPQPYLFLNVAGAAVLLLMVLAGIILARSRSLQVKEFGDKLSTLETGL